MSIGLEGEQQNLDESQSDCLQGEYQPSVAGEAGGNLDRTADSSGESHDDGGDVDYPILSHDSPTRKPQRPASRSGRPERRILGIRLRESSMVYRLVASFPDLAPGDRLLLQTKDGEAEGCVIFVSNMVYTGKNDPRKLYPGSITRIIRKIGEHESSQADARREKELKAKILGRDMIRRAALPMKLSRVIYQPGGTKAIFYFTSEVRVDFRDLVKQLSEELSVRVEMRHVGVRDETRLLGGVGHCGKDFCCSQYLQKFHPVSVRMAKNQDLSLNPDGISGVCGRLMCCLAYENEAYIHLRESLPVVKENRWTRDGREVLIRSVQPLRGRVTCQFADGTRENCPAADLLPEKPAVTSAMPTVSEDFEEKITEEVVVAAVAAPPHDRGGPKHLAENENLGNEKRRSRKRKNRKKTVSVQDGSSGEMPGVVSSHREAPQSVVPADSGVSGQTQGVGEGGTPGKKRRRKRRKNSGNRGNGPSAEVNDNA
ncbi:MAG: hypothetical protein HQL75_03010 [Magnetococcales bacterium]|nr:hypothetical protein [Magnetococcales bacterium]